jgi:hypothetical protein
MLLNGRPHLVIAFAGVLTVLWLAMLILVPLRLLQLI